MPSPVGHALGGAIVALGVLRKRADLPLGDIALCVAAACAPDLDFLWGRHGMETHSIGAALLAGGAVWATTGRSRLGAACALAWLSHVLFDWLGSDDFPPIGVMALWPLSSNFYFANAFLFDTISRRYWLPGFWSHNIVAVMKEAAWLAPPTVLLAWWRWRVEIRKAFEKVRRS